MRTRIAIALACVLLGQPAAAQSAKALARQYIEMPVVQEALMDAWSPETLMSAIDAQLPPGIEIGAAKKAAVAKIFAKHLQKAHPATVKALIDAAAQTYSPEELKAMIAFARSEAGASSIRKTPIFLQAMDRRMAPEMRRMQAQSERQVMKILLQ